MDGVFGQGKLTRYGYTVDHVYCDFRGLSRVHLFKLPKLPT